MEKAKIGLNVSLLVAVTYLLGYFNGYLAVVLLVGYVLLKEDSLLLKKQVLQVLTLMLAFSLVSTAINLIPDLFRLLYETLSIIGIHPDLSLIYDLFSLMSSVLALARTVVFVALGLMALLGKTIALPGLDKFLDKQLS